MRRLTVALVLVVVLTTVSLSGFAQARRAEKPEKAKDPVCGMMVDKDPHLSMPYKGENYFFCSKADMDEFKKAPDKYTKL